MKSVKFVVKLFSLGMHAVASSAGEKCGPSAIIAAGYPSGIQEFTLSTIRISTADMIALRVRAKGSKDSALPGFLYQSLPISAMSLMATLPRGDFPVSIPHLRKSDRGFSILKSQPAHAEAWVIVYALKPNRRYEATEILFQGQRFGIEDFCKFASLWVDNHAGHLGVIPGRFAYFAPTRELWSVILGDCGYVAVDPSKIQNEITPEVRQRLEDRLTSGVVVRIPLQTGDKLPPGATLPVFTQVELSLDPHQAEQSRWLRFDEYKKDRDAQAQPPAAIIPDFLEWLERLAAESGFESWIFRPGMLFGDCVEWWGDRNRRRTQHEGLDFAEGRQPGEKTQSIPEGTPVRAMADGEVIAILDDFINRTVVVRHPAIINESGKIFFTLYSHIQPETGLSGTVSKGQLLGTAIKSTTAGAPAHLHFTGAWIPQSVGSGEITMDQISSSYAPVVLTDFNGLLGKEK